MLKSMTDAPVPVVPATSSAPPVSLADMAAAATQNASAAPATASADSQNPLDALEAILQQAKAKTDPTVAQVDPNAPPAPDPAVEAAAEEARKQAELAALEAENKLQDEAKLKAELDELKQVSGTSAEQARLAQQTALQQDQEQRQQEHAVNQIRQLGHTKI